MILTGGDIYGFETSVTEYSNLLENSISRQLPPLLKGRSMHACGRLGAMIMLVVQELVFNPNATRYMVGDTIKLVVTGGQTGAAGSWNVASSTEVETQLNLKPFIAFQILDYSGGDTWRHAEGDFYLCLVVHTSHSDLSRQFKFLF